MNVQHPQGGQRARRRHRAEPRPDRRRPGREGRGLRQVLQGCNSIDIISVPECGPEPGSSYVWSFGTCQTLKCTSTEVVSELGPVLRPVLCPKFQMSIE